jgi:hypothetical protein
MKCPECFSSTQVGTIYYLLGKKDRDWERMQKTYEARDTGSGHAQGEPCDEGGEGRP